MYVLNNNRYVAKEMRERAEEALKTLGHQGRSWRLSQSARGAAAEDIKKIIRLSESEGKA